MSNQVQNAQTGVNAKGEDLAPVSRNHRRPGMLDVRSAHPAARPAINAISLASRQAAEVSKLDVDEMTVADAVSLASKFAQQVVELGDDAAALGTVLAIQAMKYNTSGTASVVDVMKSVTDGIESLFRIGGS